MDAASIEQVNKIRQSLGLPLLSAPGAAPPTSTGPSFKEHASDDDSDEDPASTLETREAAGYTNFKELRDEDKRRLEREQRKKQIQKARDAAARSAKLEGKGLGDVDEGEQDAKSWLKGQKKRQAKIERDRAEKLAQELAERERLAALEYTSGDLAGVQVAHEVDDFENGETDQILTLQDKAIGDEDASDQDDVLENADIIARDKLKERLDLKKRKAYDVNADDNGVLLSQYDDKKRKAFTLDGKGATTEEREAKRQDIGDKLKTSISLDIFKSEPVSDYQEIKMKKPKKTKKKNLRQRPLDDDDDILPPSSGVQDDIMDVDKVVPAPLIQSKKSDTNFIDDEDLAGALAMSRRAALKKQKRKPEDIIRMLKEEEDQSAADTVPEGGLVVDDTTNFLDNLSSRPADEQPEPAAQKPVVKSPESTSPTAEDEDQPMGEVHSVIENEEDLLEGIRHAQATDTPEISHTGLDEEKTLDNGLAATLNLLKQRGMVKESDGGDKNTLYRDRQKFIIDARMREYDGEQKARAQRERDRNSGKMNNMSMKEREEHARWQNTQREHQSSIQAAAAFNREYKPDVQIKYVDDNGRYMNQKEAFKHLSHQFHGKGSGKQKTEKHLKKVADEKKRDAASVLDSSRASGMNNALGAQTKKNKEAGVRLA